MMWNLMEEMEMEEVESNVLSGPGAGEDPVSRPLDIAEPVQSCE